MTMNKSNIIEIKFDEDPLQHLIFLNIYRFTGNDIFIVHGNLWGTSRSSKTRGEYIKDHVKRENNNILHTNIYVYSRRSIAKFPVYGVKYNTKP